MVDVVSWLLLLTGSITPPAGGPGVVVVPGWALNWVSLPQPDVACSLMAPGVFADVMGRKMDLRTLRILPPPRRPVIVVVAIDLNRFSPWHVLATMRRLRDDWNPGVRAVIFITLIRVKELPPASNLFHSLPPNPSRRLGFESDLEGGNFVVSRSA
jgi:hypothetical protein